MSGIAVKFDPSASTIVDCQPTLALRWLLSDIGATMVLQQKWQFTKMNGHGYITESGFEWRDVPVETD